MALRCLKVAVHTSRWFFLWQKLIPWCGQHGLDAEKSTCFQHWEGADEANPQGSETSSRFPFYSIKVQRGGSELPAEHTFVRNHQHACQDSAFCISSSNKYVFWSPCALMLSGCSRCALPWCSVGRTAVRLSLPWVGKMFSVCLGSCVIFGFLLVRCLLKSSIPPSTVNYRDQSHRQSLTGYDTVAGFVSLFEFLRLPSGFALIKKKQNTFQNKWWSDNHRRGVTFTQRVFSAHTFTCLEWNEADGSGRRILGHVTEYVAIT